MVLSLLLLSFSFYREDHEFLWVVLHIKAFIVPRSVERVVVFFLFWERMGF